jgi:hypothetical protein
MNLVYVNLFNEFNEKPSSLWFPLNGFVVTNSDRYFRVYK